MAIILKQGKTYSPQNNQGLDLTGSDYYGAIDEISYNKYDRSCFWQVVIYANKDSRDEGKSKVDAVNFSFLDENFDSEIGRDGYTIAQAYTKSMEQLTDWESDE